MFDKFSSSDIALIAAVISPVIVAVISEFRHSHREKVDFYYKHECDVIESYLKSLGQYIYNHHDQSAAANYGTAHAEIYMYIPHSMWYLIDNMDIHLSQLINAEFSEISHRLALAKVMYENLCKSFAPLSRHPNRAVRFFRRLQLSKTFDVNYTENADSKNNS